MSIWADNNCDVRVTAQKKKRIEGKGVTADTPASGAVHHRVRCRFARALQIA